MSRSKTKIPSFITIESEAKLGDDSDELLTDSKTIQSLTADIQKKMLAAANCFSLIQGAQCIKFFTIDNYGTTPCVLIDRKARSRCGREMKSKLTGSVAEAVKASIALKADRIQIVLLFLMPDVPALNDLDGSDDLCALIEALEAVGVSNLGISICDGNQLTSSFWEEGSTCEGYLLDSDDEDYCYVPSFTDEFMKLITTDS